MHFVHHEKDWGRFPTKYRVHKDQTSAKKRASKLPKRKASRASMPSVTLPKTNSSPLKIGCPKRKLLFQPSICRCYISFREGNCTSIPMLLWTCRLQSPPIHSSRRLLPQRELAISAKAKVRTACGVTPSPMYWFACKLMVNISEEEEEEEEEEEYTTN